MGSITLHHKSHIQLINKLFYLSILTITIMYIAQITIENQLASIRDLIITCDLEFSFYDSGNTLILESKPLPTIQNACMWLCGISHQFSDNILASNIVPYDPLVTRLSFSSAMGLQGFNRLFTNGK